MNSALRTFITAFLLFLWFGPKVGGQTNNSNESIPQQDSINKWLKDAWGLARVNPSGSLNILAKIDSTNATLPSPFKEDIVLYYYGVFYKNLNLFAKSEEYFDKSLEFYTKKGDTWKIASVNMVRANLFSDVGNYEKSMVAATAALRLYESINDTIGILNSSNKLSYLLLEINNFTEALKYARNSIRLSQLIDAKSDEANAYTNSALIYEKLKQSDSVLFYYRKAYVLGEEQGDEYAKFNNNFNMASVYETLQKLDSASFYAEKAVAISEKLSVPALTAAAKRLMGKIRLAQGRTTEAISTLEHISPDEMKTLGLRDQMENYGNLSLAYEASKDFTKAFYSLEKYKLLSDSLTGENSRNKINELEITYQTEKKQQQIGLLNLENENAQLQLSRKNRTLLLVSVGLVLISVLSIILFLLIRKYLKQKTSLARALGEKDILLREIHHRVKNNLQLVSSLLTLQGESIDDQTVLRAINEGKSRVRSMALIHQDLYQNENITAISAQTYLLKLCNELFQTYAIKEHQVELKTQIQEVDIDVDTLIPLGLILNELITNCLKYAFPDDRKGTIVIVLKEENNRLIVHVKDNGVGYDPGNVRVNSFGTVLISSLIQQLEGEVKTVIDHGTQIILSLKEYQISKPK